VRSVGDGDAISQSSEVSNTASIWRQVEIEGIDCGQKEQEGIEACEEEGRT
jgi:hypothetical protein